jgi:hypothetical protein
MSYSKKNASPLLYNFCTNFIIRFIKLIFKGGNSIGKFRPGPGLTEPADHGEKDSKNIGCGHM